MKRILVFNPVNSAVKTVKSAIDDNFRGPSNAALRRVLLQRATYCILVSSRDADTSRNIRDDRVDKEDAATGLSPLLHTIALTELGKAGIENVNIVLKAEIDNLNNLNNLKGS